MATMKEINNSIEKFVKKMIDGYKEESFKFRIDNNVWDGRTEYKIGIKSPDTPDMTIGLLDPYSGEWMGPARNYYNFGTSAIIPDNFTPQEIGVMLTLKLVEEEIKRRTIQIILNDIRYELEKVDEQERYWIDIAFKTFSMYEDRMELVFMITDHDENAERSSFYFVESMLRKGLWGYRDTHEGRSDREFYMNKLKEEIVCKISGKYRKAYLEENRKENEDD